MSGNRQIFKLSTLKTLLDEKNSSVSLVSCTRLLTIPPFFLNDMKGGVIFSLNKILKTYDQSLNGIIIGYQNITILWDEDSGKVRMGGFEAELNVRVQFYVFQPRIGNILEGLVNKKSEHHIGCLVHRCFNATILKPDDVTCEDWFCKKYNISDKVLFKVKDLDFTGSVPYIEGEIDEILFNQCRPSMKNLKCNKNSGKTETKVNNAVNIYSQDPSTCKKYKKKKKDKEKKDVNDKKKICLQEDQSNVLHSSKSALDNNLNSELKINESMKMNDRTAIFGTVAEINTERNMNNQDEVDKEEPKKTKKKKDKKNKKKDKEVAQIQIEDLNTVTKEKCVDGLYEEGFEKESFDAEFSKSKKTKKKKKEKSSSKSKDSKTSKEDICDKEETDNVFYSTKIDPSKTSEKLNITFCSPIFPEMLSGNKKRKKEKDRRKQALESTLEFVKKGETELSTKDKKLKSLKRKREGESESEGVSTPKKYKNGNMYDVVYSPTPQKSYVENKSLFSDSEKSFKMSPFKKNVKLNGDVHDMSEKCDIEENVLKSTVQSLLDEVRKEVSARFQSESEVQNGDNCQIGENNEKSKTVKTKNKVKKTTKKKKKKKEKEKSKIRGNKETSFVEKTSNSLYDKLLQEAMNSINLTNDDATSPSSTLTKSVVEKKHRRKKTAKESTEA